MDDTSCTDCGAKPAVWRRQYVKAPGPQALLIQLQRFLSEAGQRRKDEQCVRFER
jgi:hypothetical protein